MVIDCCIFLNELDMLEARLDYLDQHVDKFVVVESNYTFNGNKKPYHIDNNYSRFRRFGDKLTYIRCDLSREVAGRDFTNLAQRNQWVIESCHRNSITKAFDQFNPSDVVMISDLDEIPNRSNLSSFINMLGDKQPVIALEQMFFYYNFKCINQNKWVGPIVSTVGYVEQESPEHLRSQRFNLPLGKNGGWHLSYWGSPRQIQYKIDNFSHQEVNLAHLNNVDNIRKSIIEGRDLYNRAEERWIRNNIYNIDKDLVDIFSKLEYKI